MMGISNKLHMKTKDNKNIVAARIHAGGNVIVGDKNIINILKEAAQYKDLEAELNELYEQLARENRNIDKYPGDEEFVKEELRISQKINDKLRQKENLEKEVIKLAEEFSRIPINTDRLRLAKKYFESGEFEKARGILDAEKMKTDQNVLLSRREKLKRDTLENEQKLLNNSNEFLILARLTSFNYSLPDRFEKSKEYFERSLVAQRNKENLFGYAWFLQMHDQLIDAIPFYEEALKINRGLAKNDLQTYFPEVADILNNMAVIHKDLNEFNAAERKFNEALEIRRKLAKDNPQNHLPDVAVSLTYLANLHREKNEFDAAEKEYNEAYRITMRLAKINPQTFLPQAAKTLNDSANFYIKKKKYDIAEKKYINALEIYEKLAASDSQTYLPGVTDALDN